MTLHEQITNDALILYDKDILPRKKLEFIQRELLATDAKYDSLFTRYQELEKELEAERKLNAEIKARFVKCNTCTPDMKEKCLMFNENLCEGERCEELVDLIALVNKRDTDDKLTKAKEIIRQFLNDYPVITKELLDKLEQFVKEE